jgi:hypothetical protein
VPRVDYSMYKLEVRKKVREIEGKRRVEWGRRGERVRHERGKKEG